MGLSRELNICVIFEALTRYTCGDITPQKWPHKLVNGVMTLLIGGITPFITSKGPPCVFRIPFEVRVPKSLPLSCDLWWDGIASYSSHDFLQKVIPRGPFFLLLPKIQRSGKTFVLGHQLNETHLQNIQYTPKNVSGLARSIKSPLNPMGFIIINHYVMSNKIPWDWDEFIYTRMVDFVWYVTSW